MTVVVVVVDVKLKKKTQNSDYCKRFACYYSKCDAALLKLAVLLESNSSKMLLTKMTMSTKMKRMMTEVLVVDFEIGCFDLKKDARLEAALQCKKNHCS